MKLAEVAENSTIAIAHGKINVKMKFVMPYDNNRAQKKKQKTENRGNQTQCTRESKKWMNQTNKKWIHWNKTKYSRLRMKK